MKKLVTLLVVLILTLFFVLFLGFGNYFKVLDEQKLDLKVEEIEYYQNFE